MDIAQYAFIGLVGLLAGFINVIVGSGSSVVVPFLIFLGLPPIVAVGTNRFAMLFNNLTGAVRYHIKEYLHPRIALTAAAFAALGAVLGAYLLLGTPAAFLKQIIAGVLFVEVVALLFNTKRMGLGRRVAPFLRHHYIVACIFGFVAGIYGGFLGMAITSLLMFFLVALFGLSFIESAAAAKVIAFALSTTASVVFIMSGKVQIGVAITLTVSTILGAYFGVNSAIKIGDARIRTLFIAVLLISAFLLVFDFGIKI